MCIVNKHGRPSALCLVPLALVTMLLGGGLVGTWVSCYYKCLRGKTVEYNYYAAVWTGGLAIFSGLFQLFLACCWNKAFKYITVFLNVILLLCCLLCGALYSYVTYLEVEDTPATETTPTVGMILTGLQAVLAVVIMFFSMIWVCVIACTAVDDGEDAYVDSRKKRQSRTSRSRGPYDTNFFNREPGIYQAETQERQRPPEVSYGQPSLQRDGTVGGSTYIIPRASVRGAPKEDGYMSNGRQSNGYMSNGRQSNGYQSNGYPSNGLRGSGRRSHPGGTMVVDGRESHGRYGQGGGEENRGFYSGSSRYANSLPRSGGGALQNGGARRDGSAYPNGTGGRGHFGNGISLMQMHGVAPAHNISDGYY